MSCAKWFAAALLLLSGLSLSGCRSYEAAVTTSATSTVLIVNGADGPGPWYNSLVEGLKQGGAADRIERVNWGAPWLVWPNLSFTPLHTAAEKRLVARIDRYRKQSPEGSITLVGHSAGCGVILDALKRLPEGTKVENVILLAPAVSNGYDVAPAIPHVEGRLHVFYSGRDQLLLRFSTRLTGTYDHVWTGAAGFEGFTDQLPADLAARFEQHAYQPEWKALGHNGGHFGYRSPAFAASVLAPLAAAGSSLEPYLVRFTPSKPASHIAAVPTTRPAVH